MDDTSAYVRGPDFAVVYLLGDKFASSWTQDRTLHKENSHSDAQPVSAQRVPLNSPFERTVLAGRSIYYGALLYLGHLTSYFWLSVFLQAAIFIYLTYIFTIKCAGLSFSKFVGVVSLVLIVTPASFFISFLMPDIFASFLILSAIILVGFWHKLRLHDKICVLAIPLLSVLFHTSHLLLLGFIELALAGMYLIKRRTDFARMIFAPVLCLMAIIVLGIVGELGFSYATKLVVGVEPTRPPFLMARIIDDGPGYRFLKMNCPDKRYTACNYIDRLPTTAEDFLWSLDRSKGVYNLADVPTRKALASEQTSFVVDVFKSDPVGVITAAMKNTANQLLKVDLGQFFHTPAELEAYKQFLPEYYFDKMLHSRAVEEVTIVGPLSAWFSIVYYLSIIALILTFAFWPRVNFKDKSLLFPQPQWLLVLSIACLGVVFNAAICGALSTPSARYQARVSWIPLFILLVMLAKLWGLFLRRRTVGLSFWGTEIMDKPLKTPRRIVMDS